MSLFRRNIMMARKAPTPIYLTQWKIVGNSEVHGNEIWSCGEYNPTDGKYHILVQPLGGSIADIALDAPLRKVEEVADTIEFPSETEDKALVKRNLNEVTLGTLTWTERTDIQNGIFQAQLSDRLFAEVVGSLCVGYTKPVEYVSAVHKAQLFNNNEYSFYYSAGGTSRSTYFVNRNYAGDQSGFEASVNSLAFIYQLATPTTELVDAPQIEEAESYSMVISQGAKAVEWSSFETE